MSPNNCVRNVTVENQIDIEKMSDFLLECGAELKIAQDRVAYLFNNSDCIIIRRLGDRRIQVFVSGSNAFVILSLFELIGKIDWDLLAGTEFSAETDQCGVRLMEPELVAVARQIIRSNRYQHSYVLGDHNSPSSLQMIPSPPPDSDQPSTVFLYCNTRILGPIQQKGFYSADERGFFYHVW